MGAWNARQLLATAAQVDVGGSEYKSSAATLQRSPKLASMLDADIRDNKLFIDRDGEPHEDPAPCCRLSTTRAQV